MQEPLVTWNLYLTPLAVGLSTGVILFYITRLFRKQDVKDKKIEDLLAEAILLKEQNTLEWRKAYTITVGHIKATVERIEKELTDKVSKEDCVRDKDHIWAAIDKK